MYRLASGGTPSSRQTVAAAETRRNPSRPRVDIELKTCGLHDLWWLLMVYDGDHPKGSMHPASMADHEPFSLVLFHFSRAATVSPTLSQAHVCNSKVVSFWFFLSTQAGQAACVFGPLGVSYQIIQRNHIQPSSSHCPTICLRSARVALGPPSLLRPSQHEVDNSEGFEGTSPALFWVDITWTRVSWAKHAPKYAAFNWGKG